ncbi:MAG TPA: NifU family protein [Jatrophihabitantaceae bacterium]|jgi:Fe-S cluster biogenesis protein NfuA/nitrite reductase/ring-hydroxylating ferredoxin subunit
MDAADVRALPARIEELLDSFDDSRAAERAEDLVAAVLSLYGEGLRRVVARAGDDVVRQLVDDDLVAGLLLLHGLHPDNVATRVQRALDEVRPYLGSHAGGIDFLGVDAGGVAHLRLQGSCDHCPSSSVTVQSAVERAVIEAAPDVVRVEVEGMVEARPLLQIGLRPPRPEPGDGWRSVELTAEPGALQRLPELGVVAANLAGTFYVYRDRCPACGADLGDARLAGDELQCAGCDRRFDARLAGRALDADIEPLAPVPLLPDGAGWRLAVPRAAVP